MQGRARAIAKSIGAFYKLDPVGEEESIRALEVDMCDYVASMQQRFHAESGTKPRIKDATTPYVSDQIWGSEDSTPGRYRASCSSHAATALFVSRVARPDISCATQRLCSNVSKWSTVHDAALAKLMAYVAANERLVLHASLAPSDLNDLVLRLYTDADWAGD